jgi:cyanate lyase
LGQPFDQRGDGVDQVVCGSTPDERGSPWRRGGMSAAMGATAVANRRQPVQTSGQLDKRQAGELVARARVRKGVAWTDLAAAIDRPLVWTVAALLGKHPLPPESAEKVCQELGLGTDIAEALCAQPYRVADPALASDPTIYRFHEALDVYGEALKELIHEEFGDGIMSAINFKVDFARRSDPGGDRVVVTFDGKFLPYQW